MLFRRRIFALVLLGMIPMAVGIANGVILSNRMTPFTVKDFSNLKDGAAIITTYFFNVDADTGHSRDSAPCFLAA